MVDSVTDGHEARRSGARSRDARRDFTGVHYTILTNTIACWIRSDMARVRAPALKIVNSKRTSVMG